MDEKTSVRKSLELQSFLKGLGAHLKDALATLEVSDHLVLESEVKLQQLEEQNTRLEKELSLVKSARADQESEHRKTLEAKAKAKEMRDFLLDLQGFLEGKLFRGSAAGAKFFTLDQASFALRVGVGELGLEDAVRTSSDAWTFPLRGKSYYALRADDGSVYFHL